MFVIFRYIKRKINKYGKQIGVNTLESSKFRGSEVFYPEWDLTLKIESETESKPELPLNSKEMENIRLEVYDHCIRAYVNRMLRSGHMGSRSLDDVRHDGHLFFEDVLRNKFDKSKCGEISDKNYAGAKAPKKVSWYFKILFERMVNSKSGDFKKAKKRRLIGSDSVDSSEGVKYDPVDSISQSKENMMDLMNVLRKEVSKLSPEIRELFQLKVVEGHQEDELRELVDGYSRKNETLQKFLNEFVIKNAHIASDTFNKDASNFINRINKKKRKDFSKKEVA